jgi:signal peptidase I
MSVCSRWVGLTRIAALSALPLLVIGWLFAGPSQLGGGAAYVTTHGVSMQPRIKAGDLVLVRPATSYRVGDVVAYRATGLRTAALHRIVAVEGDRYVFQGDNNSWLDPERPKRSELVGKEFVRIPGGGRWLRRLTTPLALGLISLGLLAAGGTATTRRKRKRGTVSRHIARPTGASAPMATWPPALRTAAAGTAAAGLLGVALGFLAWTGPAHTPATTETKATRQMAFTYTASVRRSAAYDGTKVTAPDPVFRRLTNTVDVHFTYTGGPGSVAVVAELSTPSGWRSTVPLSRRTRFPEGQYDGTVRLDLNAFEARAKAAGVVTGLPADPVTVRVVPRVRTADGATFAPGLELTLTEFALRVAGDPPALTVADSTATTRTTRTARTLGLLGRTITVATARTLSLILALGALLAAGILALIARRTSPDSEGAGIRRRYGPLLVPVHPMPTPPGRPVVDVPEFATLARLAERYGLLVLHWSRSDVETFVVQDESTTYRYRTDATDPADVSAAPVEAPAAAPASPAAASVSTPVPTAPAAPAAVQHVPSTFAELAVDTPAPAPPQPAVIALPPPGAVVRDVLPAYHRRR